MPNSEPSAIPQPAAFPTSSDSDFDFLVIGSGFAGSLIATILQTQGRRVAIADRSSHPRFAIGESSTPAANLILSSLADQYDLAWLKPLAKYGTWKATYPNITTGRKRGFSYFQHQAGKPFQPQADQSNELLAAASSSDEVSDTQWLRSDVDAFFFHKACESGVAAFENSEVSSLSRTDQGWAVKVCNAESTASSNTCNLRAEFLIDASGAGQVLAQHLGIKDEPEQLATHSRAIFAHVTGLPEWQSILEGSVPGSTSDHPFQCDFAALHHILEEGWMWWLRFDSDVTSIGLVLDHRSTDQNSTISKLKRNAEFHEILSRYPSLNSAFKPASVTNPKTMPIRTTRLQRLASQIAGDDWAMLPHTAGFVDPLHSTGIAHSLAGVERLAKILLVRNPNHTNALPDPMLQAYDSTIRKELTLIDQLVVGCYDAIAEGSFRKLAAFTMCYFAAATTWERQRLNHRTALTSESSPHLVTRSVNGGQSSAPPPHPALLCADDAAFRAAVAHLKKRLPDETDESFETLCKETLAPFNHVGLFEPPIPNMYGGTALPEAGEDRTSNIELPTSKS